MYYIGSAKMFNIQRAKNRGLNCTKFCIFIAQKITNLIGRIAFSFMIYYVVEGQRQGCSVKIGKQVNSFGLHK